LGRSRVIGGLAAAAGTLACAGGAGPGAAGGHRLAYDVPDPNPAVYTFSDTTEFSIHAGPIGVMRVLSAQSGVAEIAFRRSGGGIEATVRVPSYAGRFENPDQGVTSADETDIRGAWTVRLDPGDPPDVVTTPSLTPRGRQVAGGESLVRPLFAHLPGRGAAPGGSWVDTVAVTEDVGGAVSRARTVITSTLVGDTVIAGRRLLLIRTSSATAVEVDGTSGGVEIRQRIGGTMRGTVLWDAARSVLVERSERGELEGVLELQGADVGLPVEATVRRSVSLRR
jgi:hypothetical protein